MHLTHSVRLVVAAVLFASFSGCYSQLSSLEPPTFSLILEGSGLIAFDPPLIGAGEAVFRLNLEATNPNTVALTFTDITFDLFINDRLAGEGHTTDKVHLPPKGSARFAVTATVPLDQAPELVADIERLLAGEPTHYRIEGTATAEAVGLRRRLTSVVLAEGTIEQPFPLQTAHVHAHAVAGYLGGYVRAGAP